MEDGTGQPGDVMLTITGPVVDMLKAERVALNLLQRLCGIATMTRRFVEKVRPHPARITDTRKTTPVCVSWKNMRCRWVGGPTIVST